MFGDLLLEHLNENDSPSWIITSKYDQLYVLVFYL